MYFWNLFNKCIYENIRLLIKMFRWYDDALNSINEWLIRTTTSRGGKSIKTKKVFMFCLPQFFFNSFDILLD